MVEATVTFSEDVRAATVSGMDNGEYYQGCQPGTTD